MSIEPGLIRNLPNDDYHADTQWLSSTVLKRALPEQYDEGAMSQPALDFGTLVHSVVLEPDNLGHYLTADAEKIGVKADGTPAQNPTMTSAWKRFVSEAEAGGKIIVAQSDWDRAHAMRDALKRHPEAAALLFEAGESEVSAFAADAEGIQHKARFDRIVPGAVVDLKTTGAKPGADSLTKTVLNFLYDLSAAHYLEVADLLDLGADTFTWVFVTKVEPYRVTVADASSEFIERGRALRDRALARLLDPDLEPYEGATGRLALTPPPWARITPANPTIPADFTWSLNDYA